MKEYWVYILECSDGTYYVGVTSDLDARLHQHIIGFSRKAYTYTRRPVKLVWAQSFDHPSDAIAAEKKLKRWSHGKKRGLIEGNPGLLHELSACRNSTHYLPKFVWAGGFVFPLFEN